MARSKKITVAQMIGPPSKFCGGVNEYEKDDLKGCHAINAALITGSEEEKENAKKLIASIDVDSIKKHSVERMVELTKQAKKENSEFVMFPELSLTSFFPYFYIEDKDVLDGFFEKGDITQGVLKPLIETAKELNISVCFGYAEKTEDGKRYNTQAIFDVEKQEIFKYRKTHIPGFEKPRDGEVSFQFEKGMFESSKEGYPVYETLGGKVGMITCHDRRYSNPFLAMGMATGKNVELVVNGYNTPFALSFAGDAQAEMDAKVYEFHYMPQQGQAITEGTYVASSSIAGDVFGAKQIAGSCIISPNGEIVAKTEKLEECLLHAEIDFDKAKQIRIQKYNGDRTQPDVILKELVKSQGVAKTLDIVLEIAGENIKNEIKSLKEKLK